MIDPLIVEAQLAARDKEIERLTAEVQSVTRQASIMTEALTRIAAGQYDTGAIGIAINALDVAADKQDDS